MNKPFMQTLEACVVAAYSSDVCYHQKFRIALMLYIAAYYSDVRHHQKFRVALVLLWCSLRSLCNIDSTYNTDMFIAKTLLKVRSKNTSLVFRHGRVVRILPSSLLLPHSNSSNHYY